MEQEVLAARLRLWEHVTQTRWLRKEAWQSLSRTLAIRGGAADGARGAGCSD